MVAIKESRPVVCYKCGAVLGHAEAEWTQEGMARFREKASTLKRDHVCGGPDRQDGIQETRKLVTSDGSR